MASSNCAPNQPFRLLRCSGRLILRRGSTGAPAPKRSTSRASPLRGSVHRAVHSETLMLQGFAPPGAPHRASPSGKPGVPVGLFERNSPQDSFTQNARPPGLRPSGCSAPNQPFRLLRCSAWLLLTAHRISLSGCSGVPVGLFYAGAPQELLLRNARPPGLRPSVGQSTGLFIPKRSCFRASPLRVLRTVLPLRESPVFRSAYLREKVHRSVHSETLMLQGFAPSGGPQGEA